MVRFARVVAPGIPHHITQRGNTRRFILGGDAERSIYLDLLHQGMERYGMALIGYCLMSNHVHLIAVPERKDALARGLKDVHGRFASYWNAANRSSGHVWQGRFYSCPLDEKHLWEALRYVELNPVRASLVGRAGLAVVLRCRPLRRRRCIHLAGYGCMGTAMEHRNLAHFPADRSR